MNFARGFWMQDDSLNRWSLRFNDLDIENRYRAHFADFADRQWTKKETEGRRKNVINLTFVRISSKNLVLSGTNLYL